MAPRLGDEIATFQFVVIQKGTVYPVPFKKCLLSHYYGQAFQRGAQGQPLNQKQARM